MRDEIVFIVSTYEPEVGGTVREVSNLGRAFASRGRKVTVLTRRSRLTEAVDDVRDGIAVVRRGGPEDTRMGNARAVSGWTSWLVARRRRIAAVQVVMHPDYLLPAAAAGLLSRSALLWVTDGDADRSLGQSGGVDRRLLMQMRRSLARRVPNVVLTSRMGLELERYDIGTPVVIPMPIDVQRFRPPTEDERSAERARVEPGTHQQVLGFVGHLEPRKGVHRLIEAFAQVSNGGSARSRLWLIGEDNTPGQEYRRALERLVRERGLESSVTFLGAVDDVERRLRALDLFVLASDREGLPNVLLEAMASGVPCIAPASAGGDELLGDGAGIVPASNNPADLAAAIAGVKDDAAALRRLGTAARRRAESFSLDEVADRFEDVYRTFGS